MPISEGAFVPGAVVRVPFPYTDAETRQGRPALVVATAGSGPGSEPFLLWVVMITSAANRGWGGDVDIPDGERAGLPVASVVRTAKIATVELARAEPRGRLEPQTLAAVRVEIAKRLGLVLQNHEAR